ncbi:MAG: leucyl aminopeptidase, partial [Rhodobacteraceae bacterium]
MPPKFASKTQKAIPIDVVEKPSLVGWLKHQNAGVKAWVKAAGFEAGLGAVLLVPAKDGTLERVVAGWG